MFSFLDLRLARKVYFSKSPGMDLRPRAPKEVGGEVSFPRF